MSDIVERLGDYTDCAELDKDWGKCGTCEGCLIEDAIDEITRLRAEVERLRGELEGLEHDNTQLMKIANYEANADRRIVRWIRDFANGSQISNHNRNAWRSVANAIERGEHRESDDASYD